MDNKNYTLVIEAKPNSYVPIYIFNSLKEIDDLTSKYSIDEFNQLLVSNYYIDNKDKDTLKSIIYSNNGIRKVREGILYKDDTVNNLFDYVINYMLENKLDSNIINKICQKAINKYMDNITKDIFNKINKNKKDDSFIQLLNDIRLIKYEDIRILYFYIKREL